MIEYPAPYIRGYIVNLAMDADDDRRVLSFPFRPQPLEQSGGANYTDVAPIGGSTDYQIFSHKPGDEVPLEIYWNALMLNTMRGESKGLAEIGAEIMGAKAFIEALTVPFDVSESVTGGAPPKCLLVVPGWCRCAARLRTYRFVGEEFDLYGNLIELRASLTFKVAASKRIDSLTVLGTGILNQGG